MNYLFIFLLLLLVKLLLKLMQRLTGKNLVDHVFNMLIRKLKDFLNV